MDLASFLIELGKSPSLRERFINDPLAVSIEYGLSEGDREALRTHQQDAIESAITPGDRKVWIVTNRWVVR